MSIRAAKLVWFVSLLLIAGCPSEDKAAQDDGSSGASGGDSGEGGSGTGGASGAESGSGGTAGEEAPNLPPEEAAAGMCEMADETAGCTGLDAYQECVNAECGFAECYSGPCAGFLNCLNDADNPCVAVQEGACEQAQECSDCFSADVNCLIGCYQHLDCGDGTAGEGGAGGGGAGGDGGAAGTGGLPEGTCDDLDACCASLSEDEATTCTTIADSARPSGDLACAVYIEAFCPTGA